jgi:hypothetical protein
MKTKVQPCPACGNKAKVQRGGWTWCSNKDCFQESTTVSTWNLISLAVQAADARLLLNNYHPSLTNKTYQEVSMDTARAEEEYAKVAEIRHGLRVKEIKK